MLKTGFRINFAISNMVGRSKVITNIQYRSVWSKTCHDRVVTVTIAYLGITGYEIPDTGLTLK